ncbi:MAG: SDR family oxidoreductase [Proteobacteria bacterium]|nr:SDR family oxidoreductase [Pseudomonadota bacterium]
MFARIFATLLLALPAVTMAATSNGPVLVTGATGQTGRLLVPALIEQGHSVRALIRNPAAAGSLPTGVQSVIADVTTPATLAAAMRGVSTVISTIGARFPIGSNGFAAVDWEGNRALIDAAKSAGVSHFILLSAGSAGKDGFPYSWSISPYPWKAKAEVYLRASGLSYTIIAAGGLKDHPAGQQGVRLAPRAEYESGPISRGDLAQVLAACVGNTAALRKTITIVNSDAITVGAWRQTLGNLPTDK